MIVVRWLFHFRQNSCPEAVPPTTAPLAMAPRVACNKRGYLLGPDGDAAYQRSIHHSESSAGEAHNMNNRSSSGPDVETAGEPEQLLGPVAQMERQARIGGRIKHWNPNQSRIIQPQRKPQWSANFEVYKRGRGANNTFISQILAINIIVSEWAALLKRSDFPLRDARCRVVAILPRSPPSWLPAVNLSNGRSRSPAGSNRSQDQPNKERIRGRRRGLASFASQRAIGNGKK